MIKLIAITSTSLLLFLVALCLSYVVIDIMTAPISQIRLVMPSPAKARYGEDLVYAVEFRRHRLCATTVNRSVVGTEDSTRHYADSAPGILLLGPNSRPSILPTHLLWPGKFRLYVDIVSTCAIITRVDSYDPVEFEVTP